MSLYDFTLIHILAKEYKIYFLTALIRKYKMQRHGL